MALHPMIDPRPRNWLPQDRYLPVLKIEIEHADGVVETDPNGLIGIVLAGTIQKLRPTGGVVSMLSGKPGLIYREYDLDIHLTPDEAFRLCDRSLRPSEYESLMRHFGVAYPWHEDFYDEQSRSALQPVSER